MGGPVTIEDTSRGNEHRREPRTPVSCTGRFMLLEHPERGWGPCRLADISPSGAGLVLFGPPWPRYESELHLFIRLDTDEASGGRPVPYLEAVVRNTCSTDEGLLRVGVEFVLATTGQRAAADDWLRVLLLGP
jgi:hypothetical protein